MDLIESYKAKEDLLDQYFDRVTPAEFYRELFPVGSFERRGHPEDHKGNGIALTMFTDGRKVRTTITDELDQLDRLKDRRNVDRVCMAPVSYYGRNRLAENLRYCYALVFDVDEVGPEELETVFIHIDCGSTPVPSFIVNSGTGLHLYYTLAEPVPMYPENRVYLKELKKNLIPLICNRYVSQKTKRGGEPDYQGITQCYRLIGSVTKLGPDYPVTAYRYGVDGIGSRFTSDPEELEQYVPFEMDQQHVYEVRTKATVPMAEAKEKWPEWYERRVVHNAPRGCWTCNRALYDWWLKQIKMKVTVGHRYYCILSLAVFAVKCGIPEEELREDAESLLVPFDKKSPPGNRFTQADIDSALEAYQPEAARYPKDDIERMTAIKMPIRRHNGRTQAVHLRMARATKAALKEVGEIRPEGRPKGSSKQRLVVEAWRWDHPDGRKIDCQRDTGLDPKTIRRWWGDDQRGDH